MKENTLFKGKIVRNTASKNPDKRYSIIGLYIDNEKTSPNYGKMSFAVKEVGSSIHSTSWWFPRTDDINKNIVFEDDIANRYYHTTECLDELNKIKNDLIK